MSMIGEFQTFPKITNKNQTSNIQNISNIPFTMDSSDLPSSKRQRLNEVDKSTIAETTLLMPPDDKSPIHILNSLNDHCLQEIFKRVSIVDLSNLCDVCTRFKRNAEEIFSLCHEKRFRFVSLTLVKPKIFENFACLMKSIYLNGSRANCCLDFFNGYSTFQSLHLRGAKVHVDKLKPLLSKLESLELSSCNFVGEKCDLFSNCFELKHLKVKLLRFEQFTSCKLPKLEKFEFDDHVYSDNLHLFLEANPQLSSISITTINKLQPPTDFIKHLLHFGNFKSLNVLKLPCFQFSVTPLIRSLRNNNIPIEQLELEDCRIDDASFQDICHIKSIKILAITGVEALTNNQFIGLAKELPKLEVIRLESPYRYAPKVSFNDIESFVQHAKNLYLLTIGIINHMTVDKTSYNHLVNLMAKDHRKTLTITIIYENKMDILVPKQTLKKNKDKIRIVKMKYDNYEYGNGNADDSDESSSSDSNYGSDNSNSGDSESSDFDSLLGSDDVSDDNSDDDWMDGVY